MEQESFLIGDKNIPQKFRPVVEYAAQQLMANGIKSFTVDKLSMDLRISKKNDL